MCDDRCWSENTAPTPKEYLKGRNRLRKVVKIVVENTMEEELSREEGG